MITKSDESLAQWAMEYALRNGCQASRVSLYNGSSSAFEIRDLKIDRLQQASENSLVIHLFVDGRYGAFSTNRLVKGELERFIQDGIDATRFLEVDKARTLPDPALYYQGEEVDLALYDQGFDQVDPDEKVSLAMRTCEEIMGKDPRVISANASYSDEKDFKYMIASNGFEGRASGSSFSLMGSVSIKGEDDARPESYWYDSALYYSELKREGIGTKALERALRKLGQRKVASGKYTMIVDNLNAATLLSPLVGAMYGSSIQQRNSFLLDRLGEKVVGDNVTIVDEPRLKHSPGARLFDSEGLATRRMPLFEAGVLRNYFMDTYSANKLETQPTVGSPSILTMSLGDKDEKGLISTVEKGIFVTGFNGGNCNSSTGDFSYGIEGFLIEKGVLTQPVSEMNVTGNMLTLWSSLREAGNDPRPSSSWKIPTLVFESVDFSGL